MSDYNNLKKVSQPLNLKVNLFPHQLVSIYKMEQLEINNIIEREMYVKETKIGVNGDIRGFGKTLSMVGLILRDKMEWDLETPFVFEEINIEAHNRIKTSYVMRFEKLPTTLILVSENLLEQWEIELKNTPLKYKKIINKTNLSGVFDYDVILVIPYIFNKLINIYSDYAWKRFIFDEPSFAKVKRMRDIFAGFYWFVTASPNSILTTYEKSKSGFMKSICKNNNNRRYLDFETRFSDIIVRNDPEFVKASFQMPLTNHQYYKFARNINIIEDLFHPSIKNMIDNDDEDINLIVIKREDLEYDTDKCCSICLESLSHPIMEKCCKNLFCLKCFIMWMEKNKVCPLCKTEIKLDNIIFAKKENKENIVLTKQDQLLNLIKNEEKRILIFANESSYLSLYYFLLESKIHFIDNLKNPEKDLQLFKSGKVSIILFNQFNLVGINLQETTDMILYDNIEKYHENWIISLANRIGRTTSLCIHHFENEN